ncbi:PIKK family atypical protein kinase [Histomonas meleagridis]|uniref:PIKK family atypical protein kinase n=1 Tax=Histomonas meleagridis TaxID=135588 RepID=UPI00355AAF97|nr:PIKK family atypical protein kinase [Histomonas meleagridis]KAH0803599.1 PIKK family atypical protein kinase [Histomonas meleagridis]
MNIQPENDLEHFCQILSVAFNTNEKVLKKYKEKIVTLPKESIKKVLPQLTMKVSHENLYIRNMIVQMLTETGKEYFQQVYFALHPYLCDDGEKSTMAREIAITIRKEHPQVAEDADIFIDGMVSCAITWFEQWMHSLEIAASENRIGNIQNVDYILNERFNDFENPRCELDQLFVRLYQDIIDEASSLFEQDDPKSTQLMWDKLKTLYASLKERMNMLSVIFVDKISPKLVKKKNFNLSVPGYNGMLSSVKPIMDVLETQQHPRCVYFESNDGVQHKFLLKGNEDLRSDERLMQFFALINGVLPKKITKKKEDVYVARYTIVPLTKNVGLIEWFTGADTFHQLVAENRERHGIEKNIESIRIAQMVAPDFSQETMLQKIELFNVISNEFKAMELFESMWLKALNPSIWMVRAQRFTVSYALMAMVGYIIGLGDRHPSNIMIQRDTGKVVHIDFGDSFDAATLRSVFPEKVPFRLTRMVVNALEGSSSSGLFKEMCIKVMQVIRSNNGLLLNHLGIFVEESQDDFGKDSTNKRDPYLLERCEKKLFGREFYSEEVSVEYQVEMLIGIAENPENYMQHYPGWCPFW